MTESKDKTLRVAKIAEGTVIDHITAGRALMVLKILGIKGITDQTVALVMNVGSKKAGRKDIVKVERRRLEKSELDKIALISPQASISIIEDYKVVEKVTIETPKELSNVVRCNNTGCISRQVNEPMAAKSTVVSM